MNLADDSRLTPGPDSPLWLSAMGDADLAADAPSRKLRIPNENTERTRRNSRYRARV